MKAISSRISHPSRRRPYAALAAFSALAAAVLWPQEAAAQTYISTVVCNVVNNLSGNTPLIELFNGVAYIAGTVLLGTGLLGFKQHTDNPGSIPFHQPVWRLIAAAGLLALPRTIAWLINTIFGTQGAGGAVVCNGTAPANANADLGQAITNLMGNISGPMTALISIISITVGVFFIVRGLLKASKFGTDPRVYSMPNIIANLIVGAILVTIGQSASVILSTLFGNGTIMNSDVANWAIMGPTQLNASPQFIAAVGAALNFFQLIGMIAFVRGFMIVKSAVEGSGQATMAQGFTHIFGGALAINIFAVLHLFDATLGTGFL